MHNDKKPSKKNDFLVVTDMKFIFVSLLSPLQTFFCFGSLLIYVSS